jgi:phosphoribosylformylglycinamidine (FGAM) synthase PurS component
MWVEGDTEEAASETVDQACHKLLSNPVMEDYTFTLEPAEALA